MNKIYNYKIIFILLLINILLYQIKIIDSNLLLYIIISIIIFNSLAFKYSLKELLILFFSLIISLLAQNLKFFVIILMSSNLKKISVKNINYFIYRYFSIGVIVFIFIIILASLNIINPKYMIYSKDVIRSGLGFKNPNTASIYYFILISHYYFYNWNKLNLYKVLFCLSGYVYIYIMTISRTGIIIGVFQTLLVLTLRKSKIIKKFFLIFPIFPFLFYILSILISFFYTKNLDYFMSYRPSTWKLNILNSLEFKRFLLGSFGNKANYFLDNGILSIQYYYGILSCLLLLFLLYKGLKNIEFNYKERTYIIFFSYLVYLLSEDMLFSPNFGIIQIFILSRAFIKNK